MRICATALVLLFVFVACGGGDDDPTRTTNQTASSTPDATSAPAQATQTSAPEATATDAATATAVVTTTPEPTATPAATETPGATATSEVAPADVQVGRYRIVPDPFVNTFAYVVGYVQNHGESDAQDVQVVVSAFDAAGAIIGSGEAFAPSLVTAGAQAPFRMLLSDIDPAAIARVDIQTQFAPYDPDGFLADYYITTFEVLQVNWDGAGWVGQVTNIGEAATNSIAIYVAGLDEAGDVIYANFSYADLDQIAPGLTSPFTVGAQSDLPAPATIITYAIGNRVP